MRLLDIYMLRRQKAGEVLPSDQPVSIKANCDRWQQLVKLKSDIVAHYAELSVEEQVVLQHVILCCGFDPVEEQRVMDLLRARTATPGAVLLLALQKLETKGILTAVQKGWGERCYVVPAEIWLSWQPVAAPISLPVSALQELEELTIWESGTMGETIPSASLQLFSFLTQLLRCGMGLTKAGKLPKNTVARLQEAIAANPAVFKICRHIQNSNSLSVDFFMEAALGLHLLTKAGNQIKLRVHNLNEWLLMDHEERERLFFEWFVFYWLSGKGKAAQIAAIWQSLQTSVWYRADVAFDEQVFATDIGDTKAIATLLHQLGWAEIATVSSSEQIDYCYFRKKATNQPQKTNRERIILQDNGEVLVQAEAFLLRWELELIGEKYAEDETAIYRLTESSIQRALMFGRTKEQLLQFLQQCSAQAIVPRPVYFMIEEWSNHRINHKEGSSINPCYPTILYDYLAQHVEANVNNIRLPQLYFTGEIPVLYEGQVMERSFESTAAAELNAAISQFPSHWTKQIKKYHRSTQREILDYACRLGIEIRLQTSNRIESFLPYSLTKNENVWEVTGCRISAKNQGWQDTQPDVVTLAESELLGIQLILPD